MTARSCHPWRPDAAGAASLTMKTPPPSFPPAAKAARPLVMGEVPPAEKGRVEIYLGTIYQRSGAIERQLPADELVLGVSKRQEVTVEIPYLSVSPADAPAKSGIGDITVGTKFMF